MGLTVVVSARMNVGLTYLYGLWLPRIRLLIIARGSHAQSQRILPPSLDNITHGGGRHGRVRKWSSEEFFRDTWEAKGEGVVNQISPEYRHDQHVAN